MALFFSPCKQRLIEYNGPLKKNAQRSFVRYVKLNVIHVWDPSPLFSWLLITPAMMMQQQRDAEPSMMNRAAAAEKHA